MNQHFCRQNSRQIILNVGKLKFQNIVLNLIILFIFYSMSLPNNKPQLIQEKNSETLVNENNTESKNPENQTKMKKTRLSSDKTIASKKFKVRQAVTFIKSKLFTQIRKKFLGRSLQLLNISHLSQTLVKSTILGK